MLGKLNKYKSKRIFSFIIAILLITSPLALAEDFLYIGGFPFGVRMCTDGVYVSGTGEVDSTVGMTSPAKDAGIMAGDIIKKINGVDTESADEVSNAVRSSKGKMLTFDILREGRASRVNVVPVQEKESGEYKAGLYVKDKASGIGTVTYVESDGQGFGGLGHGITDRYTMGVLPLKSGSVHEVEITDVTRGDRTIPGELKGTLSPEESGALEKNTEMGVFGKFSKSVTNLPKAEIAKKDEVAEGGCTIYTTLSGQSPTALDAEIVKIVDTKSNTKNFIVKLTDEEGLSRAGGIVQGMSGSPIVQNGKIVGAVTHVLLRDQKCGFGIFIENMLNAK